MSGGKVPYHLRSNKAIDRNLFMETLGLIHRVRPVNEYTYIGMGGPFLEDFKAIHARFGNKSLISIEEFESVYKRQIFNLPLGFIDCRKVSSGEFIDTYDIEGNAIIWLDYANPKQLGDQTREFSSLLRKMREWDVLRITLNANPETLGDPPGPAVQKRERRIHNLRSILASNFPSDISADEMNIDGLPGALCKVLRYVASSVMRSRPRTVFKPLASFAYSDTHQMLTVTGILIPQAEEETFLSASSFDKWDLSTLTWGEVKRIRVPELTIKERVFIESSFPKGRDMIHEEMKFAFDEDEGTSLAYLGDFIRYYRYYPYFSKIII